MGELCLENSWLHWFWHRLVTGLGLQRNLPTDFNKQTNNKTQLPTTQTGKQKSNEMRGVTFFRIDHYLILNMTLIIINNKSGNKILFYLTELRGKMKSHKFSGLFQNVTILKYEF